MTDQSPPPLAGVETISNFPDPSWSIDSNLIGGGVVPEIPVSPTPAPPSQPSGAARDQGMTLKDRRRRSWRPLAPTPSPAGNSVALTDPGPANPPSDADPKREPPVLPEASFTLASFGAPSAMKPTPRRLPKQPDELLSHVPDTAVDWVDLPTLSVRAVSARGHLHRWEGSVRQDQMALGRVGDSLVLAVSDGLGSEANSHLGAAIATRLVTTWQELASPEAVAGAELDCSPVAARMTSEAHARGLAPRTVRATLTFAVVDPEPKAGDEGMHWRVVVGQIGDSHAFLLHDGRWSRVTKKDGATDEDRSMSNVVDPLPDHVVAGLWHIEPRQGDVLALTSDGIGNLLEDDPVVADALAAQWQAAAPSPAALLYVVDASVRSYDDDRTFMGIKFGAQ